MNNYKVIDYDSVYKKIIVGNSYIHPISFRVDISNELKKNNYKGKVLFDSLLSNGFTCNRFIELYFDGKKFDSSSSKIIRRVSDDINYVLYNYYYDNPKLIEQNNILPKAHKYRLIKGNLS